jgi:hypothetical protein
MSINETSLGHLDQESIIDNHGRPRDKLTFRILRLFFAPPFPPRHPKFDAAEVALLLAAPEPAVASILSQLRRHDFLNEDPTRPGLYQYNYDCVHVEQQADLEKAFL